MCENRENSQPPETCFENTNKSFLLKRNTPRFLIVVVKPTVHAVISSVNREIPCDRNVNTRTRLHQILARRGSLPSVAEATVSASARFSRYGYAYAQNDNLSGRARRLIRISIIKTKRTPVPPCHCERSVAISRKGNVGNAPAPAKCPHGLRGSQPPYLLYNTFFNFANERRYNLTLRRGGGIISP